MPKILLYHPDSQKSELKSKLVTNIFLHHTCTYYCFFFTPNYCHYLNGSEIKDQDHKHNLFFSHCCHQMKYKLLILCSCMSCNNVFYWNVATPVRWLNLSWTKTLPMNTETHFHVLFSGSTCAHIAHACTVQIVAYTFWLLQWHTGEKGVYERCMRNAF